MFQTDQSTAAASLPTPAAAGTPGYFTNGNPGTGVAATILDADFMNMVMLELTNIVTAGGLTPSKTTYTQVRDAVKAMVGPGRLLGVQTFTASGTYTPGTYNGVTATRAIVKAVGGGGGGGGCVATGSTTVGLASGGNEGAEGELLVATGLTATTVTIGAAGAAGAAGLNNGGTGGSTSFGALMVCAGGLGGIGSTAQTPPQVSSLSSPAALVTGTGTLLVSKAGNVAVAGIAQNTSAILPSAGGSGTYGQGGLSTLIPNVGFGSGGPGASAGANAASPTAGLAGRPGYLLVYEYA